MTVVVTIRPTIPDNDGRTAFSTLRRLGVSIVSLDRATLLLVDGNTDAHAVAAAVRADETLFNENTHALSVRRLVAPEPGEAWVADSLDEPLRIKGLGAARRLTSWTMRGLGGPADPAVVKHALESLLCNPAVQHVVTHADAASLASSSRRTAP